MYISVYWIITVRWVGWWGAASLAGQSDLHCHGVLLHYAVLPRVVWVISYTPLHCGPLTACDLSVWLTHYLFLSLCMSVHVCACFVFHTHTQLDFIASLLPPTYTDGNAFGHVCVSLWLTYIFNFWHSGTLALSPERWSAWMSEIKNVG